MILASGRRVLKVLGALAVAAACANQSAFAQEEGKSSSDKQVIDYINQYISKGWTENEISPSANATDGEWLRRLFLDVIGRIPTLEETKAFQADKSEDKKAKWVDKLLFSEEYELELARNWTTIWTNLLIGRQGGNDPRRPVNRAGLQQFVRRAFLKNLPYDKFIFELVAAKRATTVPRTSSWTTSRRCKFRLPTRFRSCSWVCEWAARSATTIPSTIGSRASSGA